LWGPLPSTHADFGLRIFNPDGSEAEKSGNGLRIFARYIVDHSLSEGNEFSIETAGGLVSCVVTPDRRHVTVQMGVVSFDSREIPLTGPAREVLNEKLEIDGHELIFCAATVGNPHCVVLIDRPSSELAKKFGPLIEHHALFPGRINVQFMQVQDRANIQIEIWERGAGYTFASGSSGTAAAAVARKLDLCDSHISVLMPGGPLAIHIDDNFFATMSGPVTKICVGNLADELIDERA
jgi:diaminopimelate epimerase